MAFQWIPPGKHDEAEAAARTAHDEKRDVVIIDELTRVAPLVHDTISMAITKEAPAKDSPEEEMEDEAL